MPQLITLTGLPRSGTAFCSMLFNLHPDCIAFHELASYDLGWRKTLIAMSYKYVADCTTYGYLKQAEMPSDFRIVINSDVRQSQKSAEIACQKEVHYVGLENAKDRMLSWAYEHKALVLNRQEVFTIAGCRKIWTYCFEETFPEFKVMQLIKLNIQHHNPHIQFGKDSIFVL